MKVVVVVVRFSSSHPITVVSVRPHTEYHYYATLWLFYSRISHPPLSGISHQARRDVVQRRCCPTRMIGGYRWSVVLSPIYSKQVPVRQKRLKYGAGHTWNQHFISNSVCLHNTQNGGAWLKYSRGPILVVRNFIISRKSWLLLLKMGKYRTKKRSVFWARLASHASPKTRLKLEIFGS